RRGHGALPVGGKTSDADQAGNQPTEESLAGRDIVLVVMDVRRLGGAGLFRDQSTNCRGAQPGTTLPLQQSWNDRVSDESRAPSDGRFMVLLRTSCHAVDGVRC